MFKGNPPSCLVLHRYASPETSRPFSATYLDASIFAGPAELAEHPPYRPVDGGWLQREVVNAIQNSPKYNKTILMISFDETGGWGDQYVHASCDPIFLS